MKHLAILFTILIGFVACNQEDRSLELVQVEVYCDSCSIDIESYGTKLISNGGGNANYSTGDYNVSQTFIETTGRKSGKPFGFEIYSPTLLRVNIESLSDDFVNVIVTKEDQIIFNSSDLNISYRY